MFNKKKIVGIHYRERNIKREIHSPLLIMFYLLIHPSTNEYGRLLPLVLMNATAMDIVYAHPLKSLL